MTNLETYKKAIEKAVDRGFKYEDAFDKDWWFLEDNGDEGITLEWGDSHGMNWVNIERIIFSHAFAIAFWGEFLVCIECGKPSDDDSECINQSIHKSELDSEWMISWQYHLQQLAISEDRLKYIERFLDEKLDIGR